MTLLDQGFADQLIEALASGRASIMPLVNAVVGALPGIHVITWIAVAADGSRTVRIGTSDPARFPVGGFDLVTENDPWCRRILADKQAVICNSIAAMFDMLPDEAQSLVDMGFGATASVPIVIEGRTVGTLNLLADAGALSAATMAEVTALIPVAALVHPHTVKTNS